MELYQIGNRIDLGEIKLLCGSHLDNASLTLSFKQGVLTQVLTVCFFLSIVLADLGVCFCGTKSISYSNFYSVKCAAIG